MHSDSNSYINRLGLAGLRIVLTCDPLSYTPVVELKGDPLQCRVHPAYVVRYCRDMVRHAKKCLPSRESYVFVVI